LDNESTFIKTIRASNKLDAFAKINDFLQLAFGYIPEYEKLIENENAED